MTNTLNDLLVAVDKCDATRIREIVSTGIDVNSRTPAGCTPLMIAVMPNQYEDYSSPKWIEKTVDCLLGMGAQIELIDADGMSAHDYAQHPTWLWMA
tara:strand:- start:30 stop:320 length:291 start_codon:yes stop_codon:yes gene_type:complete